MYWGRVWNETGSSHVVLLMRGSALVLSQTYSWEVWGGAEGGGEIREKHAGEVQQYEGKCVHWQVNTHTVWVFVMWCCWRNMHHVGVQGDSSHLVASYLGSSPAEKWRGVAQEPGYEARDLGEWKDILNIHTCIQCPFWEEVPNVIPSAIIILSFYWKCVMMHTIGVVTNDNGFLSELPTSLHPYTCTDLTCTQHALLINNHTSI